MKKCKLTYSQLMKMLGDAYFAYNMYYELEMWDQTLRYLKISNRIAKAMTNPNNNYLYEKTK